MASYRAISVVCETVARLLEASYDAALLEGADLQFEVYRTRDFKTPMETGVSLFVHRIRPSETVRTLPGRPLPPGDGRPRPRLSLEVDFLLTAWAKKASLELAIMGWAMRCLQDRARVAASVLNAVGPGTFEDDEGVEVVPASLATEDLMRIWDGLPADYQVSVPYRARVLHIDSLLPPFEGPAVETRELSWSVP